MYRIQTLNSISKIIYSQLPSEKYTVSDKMEQPDGILVRSAAMHDTVLPDTLLGIARAGAGVNNIPLDRCSAQGIAVFNTPGANANAVAELVSAGLLLASRDIVGGIRWAETLKNESDAVAKLVEKGKSQFVGPELRGKTLGVIGLGAIGALVAGLADAGFGMHVIGYDPYISVENAWRLSNRIERASSIETVLANADYITFHVPLTADNKGSINQDMIGRMKNGVRILNFSRGELANIDDVKAALASGAIAKYVTDFPCADLIGTEHAICLPHLGASTPESEENCARMAAAELRDWLETGCIRNSVNLPNVPLSAPEKSRVLIIHENVPNMLASISALISAEGLNIDSLVNKARNEVAVTVLELPKLPNEETLAKLKELPHVIRIRTFGA